MMQLSSKNDDSSLCHDVIITHQKFQNWLKLKFGYFSNDIDFNTMINIFRDAISLIINQCDPRQAQCPPAAQRKQAKRAYMYITYATTIIKK